MPTLGLVHTIHTIIPVIEEICRRRLPRVRTAHFLDETILRDLMARGRMDADVMRRVVNLVVQAEAGGADAVLVTCSSIGSCVEPAAKLVSIPVRRIDTPMAAAAVRRGGRLAVAATVRTTLEPTVALIRELAARRGKRVRIEPALFSKAFQAVTSGKPELHDKILRKGLAKLAGACGTIVLAQASMARALPSLDLPRGVKILTSPETGIAQMRRARALKRGQVRLVTRRRRTGCSSRAG